MNPRKMAFWMLVMAGVAVGHLVGYTIAHPDEAAREAALGGHAYLGPVASVFIPLGLLAALWWAVRTARALGMAGRLDPRRLALAQLSVFAVQEVGERLVGGEGLTALFTERGVLVGVLAQVVVAHLIVAGIDLVRRAVRLVVAGRPASAPLRRPEPRMPQVRFVPIVRCAAPVGLRAPPVAGSSH